MFTPATDHYSARENLDRLRSWLPPIQDLLGSDYPITLSIRSADRILGQVRQATLEEALHLFTQLEPEAVRVLGPGHVNTLTNRNNMAMWTRETGGRVGTRHCNYSKNYSPDRERILGSDHPHTILTRGQIASLTGMLGKRREALQLATATASRYATSSRC